MSAKFKVGIIGLGRMAKAAAFYFKKNPLIKRVGFIVSDKDARDADLLVGALAGDIGPRCLGLALKYRKSLLDLSDVDPPGYLKKKDAIDRAGILVIPGCGFSPGLTNFILGRELARTKGIESIEIKAGSLSKKACYYPFLWCFEDIVVEHTIPSYQLLGGRKKKLPVFSGLRKERFFGIPAESYYCASGFENILDKVRLKNCTCRVVRPQGFMQFFKFLESYRLLTKGSIQNTKKILEGAKEDNITLAEIDFLSKKSKVSWSMRASSRKNEALNSMQKITASVPAVIAEMLLKGAVNKRGLVFMEELALDAQVFERLLSGIRAKGIIINRLQQNR